MGGEARDNVYFKLQLRMKYPKTTHKKWLKNILQLPLSEQTLTSERTSYEHSKCIETKAVKLTDSFTLLVQ